MKVDIQVDVPKMHMLFRRLHKIVGGSFLDFLRKEAGLMVIDAQKLTPPFGDEPIQESLSKQLGIGKQAVKNDVLHGFEPLNSLTQYKEKGKMRSDIRRLVAKGDLKTLHEVLRKAKIRNRLVSEEPTRELHESMRDHYGRVRLHGIGPVIVVNKPSINRYVRKAQELVGTAKRGWNAALRMLGREVNTVLLAGSLRGNYAGYARVGGTDLQPMVEFANLVPFAQKMREHIEGRMIQNRLRNIPIRIRAIEAHFRQKLASAGFQTK